jgi:hypothetical protein
VSTLTVNKFVRPAFLNSTSPISLHENQIHLKVEDISDFSLFMPLCVGYTILTVQTYQGKALFRQEVYQ